MINNISIKRLKTNYNKEIIAPGIQEYILEYFQNFNKILSAIKFFSYIIRLKS